MYVIISLVLKCTVSMVLFACWIEHRVGNILYRCDYTGETKFQIKPMIGYFKSPLQVKYLWYPSFWDFNSFIVIPLIGAFFIDISNAIIIQLFLS